MNIQEIEEREFVHESEAQMCFAEAQPKCGELDAQGSVPIAEALSRGRFVVVAESPYHCRATDALAGMVRSLVGDYATREEADAAALAHYNAGRYDLGDGETVYVLPRLPVVPVVLDDGEEDCPF